MNIAYHAQSDTPFTGKRLEELVNSARLRKVKVVIWVHDMKTKGDNLIDPKDEPLDKLLEEMRRMPRCKVMRVFDTSVPFNEQFGEV